MSSLLRNFASSTILSLFIDTHTLIFRYVCTLRTQLSPSLTVSSLHCLTITLQEVGNARGKSLVRGSTGTIIQMRNFISMSEHRAPRSPLINGHGRRQARPGGYHYGRRDEGFHEDAAIPDYPPPSFQEAIATPVTTVFTAPRNPEALTGKGTSSPIIIWLRAGPYTRMISCNTCSNRVS